MRAGTVGEVIHHSLNEDGHIATYDVKWEDGTIEKNVPASLVEKMNSEMHEHEIDENEMDPKKVKQAGQFVDNLADEINIDVESYEEIRTIAMELGDDVISPEG